MTAQLAALSAACALWTATVGIERFCGRPDHEERPLVQRPSPERRIVLRGVGLVAPPGAQDTSGCRDWGSVRESLLGIPSLAIAKIPPLHDCTILGFNGESAASKAANDLNGARLTFKSEGSQRAGCDVSGPKSAPCTFVGAEFAFSGFVTCSPPLK